MTTAPQYAYPRYRLFVESALAADVQLQVTDAQAHYLSHVLRMKEGDAVAVFNGQDGEWHATIATVRKKEVVLTVYQQRKPHYAPPDIWLLFAPIKHGRIDYLIEKATELGVTRLLPVITEHTMVSRVNTQRLRAHAVEAAEQCGRVDVPVVEEPLSLEKTLHGWPSTRQLFYGDEDGRGLPFQQVLAQENTHTSCAVLIGPEAGFSSKEHALLQVHASVTPVSMGPRVMRADTAALAALVCIQSARGDWLHLPKFRAENL